MKKTNTYSIFQIQILNFIMTLHLRLKILLINIIVDFELMHFEQRLKSIINIYYSYKIIFLLNNCNLYYYHINYINSYYINSYYLKKINIKNNYGIIN